MDRGRRITNRTKTLIKNALLKLIREINYPDIKVSQITEKGNVGRSTLYKHYQSKADVLVDIHKDIFENLFKKYTDESSWLNNSPAVELILLLKKHQQIGRNPFSLSYKLGNDLDYLIAGINNQLHLTIENRLRESFNSKKFNIPLPVVAQSVSALFGGLIMSWFTKFQQIDPAKYAEFIHRNIGALVIEAIKDHSR